MGFWIAAAVLLALAILPLGIRIRYNEAGFFLKVIVGPIKITVFPRKKNMETFLYSYSMCTFKQYIQKNSKKFNFSILSFYLMCYNQ